MMRSGRQTISETIGAKLSRRTLWLSLAVLLLAAVTSMTAMAASSRREATKPVLNLADLAGPLSLDPARDQATYVAYRTMTNTSIIHILPNGTYGPGLATSWRYYSTGRGANKDFEFTLRQDRKFSDGTPVTASAVVTWLKYFAEKGTAYTQPEIGPIASINAVGKWKVQIHLETSNPAIPRLLSEAGLWGDVSSPKSVADPASLATGTYGAGPYMLDPSQTIAGSQYIYIPNPYYPDKNDIRFSKVVLKIIPDPVSALQALRTGQVQMELGTLTTAQAAADAGQVVLAPPYGEAGLLFLDRNGTLAKPLADVRVRQAMNYAIDRPAICKALYGRFGHVAKTAMSASDASLPKGQPFYTFDRDKAKSLLAAAGYSKGFTVKMLVYDPFNGVQFPQAVAQYLQAVGIELDITNTNTSGSFSANQKSAKFPIQTNTLGLRSIMEDYTLAFRKGGSVNPVNGADLTLDKLYIQAIRSKDSKKYLDQMVGRITSQAYTVSVCSNAKFWYLSKNIGGASPNVLSPYPFVSELYLKK